MFTGIIQELGQIKKINSTSLEVFSNKIISKIKIGSSVSINGTCLTITKKFDNSFTADIMPETFNKTNLQKLKINDLVNLESSLTPQDEMGGHFVTGHIDCTGKITNIKASGNSKLFIIKPPKQFLKYIASKGSISIDGISLTITKTTNQDFTVAIIPHTLRNTNLSNKRINSTINIEIDIIARYLEKLTKKSKKPITLDFLNQHGYI